MCWNKDVSLNTFIFTTFSLIFIYYTNTFTKYKTLWFYNAYTYLFYFSFTSMQLLEYFLWKNINNHEANVFYSKIGLFIVIIQPLLSLMTITKNTLRNKMLIYYGIFLLFSILYKYFFDPIKMKTSVAKNGHLNWEWLNGKGIIHMILIIIWLYFYLYNLYFRKHYKWVIIGLFIFFCFYINYLVSNTWSSMWCWICNSVFIYYLINILIIQPFIEHGILC